MRGALRPLFLAMRDNTATRQRLVILAIAVTIVADLYWFTSSALSGFARIDLARVVLGAVLQAVAIWVLVGKAKARRTFVKIPTIAVVGGIALGSAMLWYGLPHAGEARVSPSIWK